MKNYEILSSIMTKLVEQSYDEKTGDITDVNQFIADLSTKFNEVLEAQSKKKMIEETVRKYVQLDANFADDAKKLNAESENLQNQIKIVKSKLASLNGTLGNVQKKINIIANNRKTLWNEYLAFRNANHLI